MIEEVRNGQVSACLGLGKDKQTMMKRAHAGVKEPDTACITILRDAVEAENAHKQAQAKAQDPAQAHQTSFLQNRCAGRSKRQT